MNNNIIYNPFIISKSIPKELFCDREEEISFLIKQIENGRNVVIMSPRRMGKTGLIHHLFQQKAICHKYHTFFIDLYATSSLQEMCYFLGKTVFEQLKSKRAQHWESVFQTLKSLRAGFKIDAITGEPKFELGIGAVEDPTTTLDEIFTYLETVSMPCIVAFDEFQQIAEYKEKRVEATLRGLIQNCRQTTFIFSGSKQHTISQMFHSKAKPFYQSAQLMDLNPLDMAVYIDFAKKLFSMYDKKLENNVVEKIYYDYGGTTWYLQMVMNELFAITGKGETCTEERIETAIYNIINVQESSYQTQISLLSSRQKGVLQAIAREGSVKSPTSAAFIKKHDLESASSVQSAIKGLMEKEILTNEDGYYRVGDYFFSHWIREEY